MSGDFQLVSPSENMQVSKDFVDKTGDAICAVCLDTQIINGTCVAECYSIEKRQLYRIKVPDGRARKTWKLRFSVARTDENGISDVENFDVLGDSPLKSTTVELDKHGVVRIKTYVAISYCPHHESYEGKVLWSEEFGRVLAGERDRVERLQVYSTWVERDKSDEAKRYGVDFRICDLLKPVTDETVVKRCRQRMMDDQEALHEKSVSTRKLSPAPPHEDMGQSTFSLNANVFAFREGKPRGNGLYVGSQLPKRLHGHERKEKISEFKKKESDNSLLLFTRKKQKFSEAWCRNLGRVIMLDIVFEGSELKEGDWFYASIRLFPELFRDVEPIYVVKKVIDLADPLAYADCFMNEIQLEIECKGKHVGSDENGRIIFEHPAIGNIVMTPEEYNVVRSRRWDFNILFSVFLMGLPCSVRLHRHLEFCDLRG
ncbi:hypothetical protein Y032_0011g1291 [Ancylostoma ceylanicum]|nr:hypothetical protein Y032_0011g1291 [Ancylostoma ceylanicum]